MDWWSFLMGLCFGIAIGSSGGLASKANNTPERPTKVRTSVAVGVICAALLFALLILYKALK